MKISTKTGDGGRTKLMFGKDVSKYCTRVEAYGAVDELSANLGLARAFASPEYSVLILEIQKKLVPLMTELATATEDFSKLESHKINLLTQADLDFIESKISEFESDGTVFAGWTQSGETPAQAALDIARTRCRYAERRVVQLKEEEGLARDFPLVFLNRLSDLIWLLSCLQKKA